MTYSLTCPQSLDKKESSLVENVFEIALGTLLIALCAQISIPLSFTPVPLTLQTLAVLFVGAKLGSKKGALCVLAYLAESIAGLPVLAGGISNPLALIGPRGGYLIGFIAQAYIFGWIFEKKQKMGMLTLLSLGALACLIQLTLGACWLSNFVGWNNALIMGFYPFVPGETLKVIAAASWFRNKSFTL